MKIHAPALALGLSLLCNTCPPLAMAEGGAKSDVDSGSGSGGGSDASNATEIAPKAEALLHKISDFYAGLKTFNTTLVREVPKGATATSQAMNYKIEAEKPAKLSIQISGGSEAFDGGQAKMDGDKLYLYNPVLGYVSSKAPSDFEDVVRDKEFQFAMGHVLHGQNLIDALLTENPYQFLLTHYGINKGSLVGEEKIDGESTEHLLLKSHRMTYDVWVDTGTKPWVRRVSSERTNQQGERIALVFNYKNPSAATTATASEFAFKAPAGAKEIATFFTPVKEPEKQAQATDHPLLNKPAPQLTLDTIGGGRLDLDSLKSKNVVVLDFWATWCPPCREALPILAEVTKSYEDKGVKFFAVDLKEDSGKIQDFLKKQGLTINVALDKDGSAAAKYGVEGIPQSVIIGKDGIVRVVHVGFSPSLKDNLPAELDHILSGSKETVSQ